MGIGTDSDRQFQAFVDVVDEVQGETLQYFTDVQVDLASNEEEYGRNLDGCRSLLDDFNNARTSQQNDVS
ncbi:hypothetical protein F442_10809 [Phytophthora nicotianae P10297]|uniref:Uncharacterized protein n=2 Tax=Phytophthora nicotianae TaxID=4792 RepID=W2Z7V8_PHYNI|nr:hypothetical protein L914_10494 [Phytophthora nicotianae]ETP42289.1 hypothetical protein F442_10809 [Phytophthora nicotianae P10297]